MSAWEVVSSSAAMMRSCRTASGVCQVEIWERPTRDRLMFFGLLPVEPRFAAKQYPHVPPLDGLAFYPAEVLLSLYLNMVEIYC